MDNLRGLLSIRRMDRVPNARIRELCGVRKGLDEGMLRWFAHLERMESRMIAKRVYVGEYAGSRSAGRPRKRWLETVKECLMKRGLDVRRQATRIEQDRTKWLGLRGIGSPRESM